MLILFSAVLIIGVLWVAKILLSELAKFSLSKPAPILNSDDFSQANESDKKIEKLETLMAEKNNNIIHLQKELRVLHIQVHAFDKVKTLMEEEIHHLREQNRPIRPKQGLPIAQTKENPVK
jgi:hypothetical protein